MSYLMKHLDNSRRIYKKAKPLLWPILAGFAFFICHPVSANASIKISPEGIQQQIIAFIETEFELDTSTEEIDIAPHKISSSLRLPKCTQPLDLVRTGKNANHYGRHTIKVSCSSPRWSFYSGATVKAYGTVITASSPIGKGEIVTKDHIKYSKVNLAKMNGNVLTEADSILGLAAKRPIRQGYMLTHNQFEAPKLIKRGDGIMIQAVSKLLTVSTPGEALTHGRLGENIRVRNLKSDREVIARVKDRDTVIVMLY
ncbi:flagellar basal body P-ring formation chaperone FlgA [Litoribacillus peritrichatus]|uniref:flagellar basal body P-ring formation chaperone FlgA n=1 Tax=Litoribacillus peritrichatus TaxID=718191 RepID=UPI0031CF27EE